MAGIRLVPILIAIFCLLGLRLLSLRLPIHMDEYDYLFIGRQLINGDSWPSLSYVFGSDFSWYLFGWFEYYIDGICEAGICGPRILSLLFGLLSLGACFAFTRSLSGSYSAALLATALLAVTAPHIFISTITTYDVIAFTLFSWSVAFAWALFSKQTKPQFPGSISYYNLALFTISILSLAAAVLSKYIVLLLLPWIFQLSLLVAPMLAITGAVLLCTIFLTYYLLNRDSLQTLIETQLNGVHGANITHKELLEQIVSVLGFPVSLLLVTTAIATLLAWQQKNRQADVENYEHSSTGMDSNRTNSVLCIVLMAATLPVYHLFTLNRIALAKHLVYSHFFLLPLLAWSLVILNNRIKSIWQSAWVTKFAITAIFSLYCLNNIIQFNELKRGYPDMSNLVNFMDSRPTNKTNTRILSEDPYIFRYLLGSEFDQSHIRETTYLDNDLDGQFTDQDVVDALWDRKYQWVLLTDQIHPAKNARFRHIMKLREYQPVFKEPYYLSGTLSGNRLGYVQLFKSH